MMHKSGVSVPYLQHLPTFPGVVCIFLLVFDCIWQSLVAIVKKKLSVRKKVMDYFWATKNGFMFSDLKVKENIERIRKEAGLSQQEMALRLGMSRTAYRKMEKGKTAILNSKLYAFCEETGVGIEEVLFGQDWTSSSAFRETAQAEERLKAQREDYESRLEELRTKISELNGLLEEKNGIISSQKGIIDFFERHAEK